MQLIDVHAEQARYAQRRLDEFLKPVDDRLYDWGRWLRANREHLGYPTIMPICKAVKYQAVIRTPDTPPPVSMPDLVAETDAAVATVPGICQKVIMVKYLWYPSIPSDAEREKLRMSRNRWRYVLRDGRVMIAQNLGIYAVNLKAL